MDKLDTWLAAQSSRRRFLGQAALGGAALAAGPALAQSLVDLHLPGGNAGRPMNPALSRRDLAVIFADQPRPLRDEQDIWFSRSCCWWLLCAVSPPRPSAFS